MRLFGSFKLTDRIRIGASTGGRGSGGSKKGKKTGCGTIIIALFLIMLPFALIESCVGGDEEATTETTTVPESYIESFEFLKNNFVYYVGETDTSWFKVIGDLDFEIEDIVLVSSDEDVVTFEFDRKGYTNQVYYKITALSPGTATIHVETLDGEVKSEEFTVIVLDEETTTEKKTATNLVANEENTKKPTTTHKSTEEKRVYVLNTSRMKIHYKSCPSVKQISQDNYSETKDFDKAIDDGYSPCGNCHPTGD